jgi:Fur family ferric uptake transcriptional regulator
MGDRENRFHDYLVQQGLKSTRQREIILDEFLRCDSHPSTEDLYLRLRKKHPGIGYATVHRTLKLFSECGIAETREFRGRPDSLRGNLLRRAS